MHSLIVFSIHHTIDRKQIAAENNSEAVYLTSHTAKRKSTKDDGVINPSVPLSAGDCLQDDVVEERWVEECTSQHGGDYI